MFCSNCGIQLPGGVNFCPNCGTRVSVVKNTVNPGNMVMLVSLGSSTRGTAAALLSRICGYSDEDALLIADSAPITVARGLNDAQARYLAQALAEYGMEVSVYDGVGWREWESSSTSVWDQTGSLLASVASALGLLGLGNRITRDMMHRTDYPYRLNGSRPPVFRVNSALRAIFSAVMLFPLIMNTAAFLSGNANTMTDLFRLAYILSFRRNVKVFRNFKGKSCYTACSL